MIPQQIINLVNLALRDGVLTYRERQTIVAEALKAGALESEINAFLDNSLRNAISQIDKESLKHCPECGGQIPLLSDNCPFCGHVFQNNKIQNAQTIENSRAAQIINQENAITQENAKNINKCPDCGAPFPVLGNVCTHCGHVLHEGQQSVFNINNLIYSIRASIKGMNNCSVSVFEMIKHRIYIYSAEISFLLFIIIANFDTPNFVAIIFAFFSVYAIISYRKSTKETNSPVEISDREYYITRAHSEKYNRHIETLYGEHKEAKIILKEFNQALTIIEKKRKNNRMVIMLINGLMMLGLFAAIFVAGSEKNMLEGSIKDHPKTYSTIERKVPVVKGIINEKGKLNKKAADIQYFVIGDSAVLTVSNRKESSGIITSQDSLFSLCLTNVHIKSSGIGRANTDTMCLVAQFFDRDGKYIKAPEMLFDETFKAPKHAYHKLPNGTKLDFHTVMENIKYEYYANFRSDRIGISQIDSLNNFLDRAYSFVLFLK